MIGSNRTLSIYHLDKDGEEKHSYPGSPDHSDIPAYIERMEPQLAAIIDERNALQTYTAIIEDTEDILFDDLIVDNNGVEYIVSGVQEFTENTDVPNHLEITMVRQYARS